MSLTNVIFRAVLLLVVLVVLPVTMGVLGSATVDDVAHLETKARARKERSSWAQVDDKVESLRNGIAMDEAG